MLEARVCCATCGREVGCFTQQAGGPLRCFECAPPRPIESKPTSRARPIVIDFAVYRSRREIREYRAS